MDSLTVIFLVSCAIWFGNELRLNRRRSSSDDPSRADSHTLRFIWISGMSALAVTALIALFVPLPIGPRAPLLYVGSAAVLLGVAWRSYAVHQLGKMFTVDVAIRKGHELKTDGIYSFIRHPSYSAAMLSVLGVGLAMNNWLSLAILVATVGYALKRRMDIEEAVLETAFGREYREYKRRTKRLIPGIY